MWCNGVEVGRHRGAHDPWHVDITEALSDGGNQEVVLAIVDPSDEGPQPLGKQSLEPGFIWYPACAGVQQSPIDVRTDETAPWAALDLALEPHLKAHVPLL